MATTTIAATTQAPKNTKAMELLLSSLSGRIKLASAAEDVEVVVQPTKEMKMKAMYRDDIESPNYLKDNDENINMDIKNEEVYVALDKE
jgi:hypothetical protein